MSSRCVLRNGLEVGPTEFANGVDVGGERGGRMKNNSRLPVYQVCCCLPRGKSGEKEVLGRDHKCGFRARKLKESLLAVWAVLTRVGPEWLGAQLRLAVTSRWLCPR